MVHSTFASLKEPVAPVPLEIEKGRWQHKSNDRICKVFESNGDGMILLSNVQSANERQLLRNAKYSVPIMNYNKKTTYLCQKKL